MITTATQRLDTIWKLASIAVDLDGTLAYADAKKPFDPEHIGAPVPKMMSRVKRWLAGGEDVDIFTARAADPKNLPPIRKWLKEQGLPSLRVTNRKDPSMKEFWDDRARAVKINTGQLKAAASWFGAAHTGLRDLLNRGVQITRGTSRSIPSFRAGLNVLTLPRNLGASGVQGASRLPVALHEVGHARDFLDLPILHQLWDRSVSNPGQALYRRLTNELEANNRARELLSPSLHAEYNQAVAPGYRWHKADALGQSAVVQAQSSNPNVFLHGTPGFLNADSRMRWWNPSEDPVSKSMRRQIQRTTPEFDQSFRDLSSTYRHQLAKQAAIKQASIFSAVRNARSLLPVGSKINRAVLTPGVNWAQHSIGVPWGQPNPMFRFLHESGHMLHGPLPQLVKRLGTTPVEDISHLPGRLWSSPKDTLLSRLHLTSERMANWHAQQNLALSPDLQRRYAAYAQPSYLGYRLRTPMAGAYGSGAEQLFKETLTPMFGESRSNPAAWKSWRRNQAANDPGFAQRFREQQFYNQDLLRKQSAHKKELPVQGFVDTPGDYAKGIERAKYPGDMSKLQPGSLVDYVIQQHDAHRRGRHLDLRAGTPDTGLYSFSSSPGAPRLPGPGERVPVARTNLHRYAYKDFEGDIPSGSYGAGRVSKVREGKLLITRTTPTSFHFTEASGPTVKRYALIRPPNARQAWLLVRANTPGKPPVEKEHFKMIPPEHADEILKKLMDEGGVATPKVDGALAYARIAKGRVELMSHRTSKRTGGYIPHTERVFGRIPEISYPKSYENTLLRGEIYGERGGKSIPPQELGGILNSSIARSLGTQQDTGTKLKMLLFGLAGSNQPYDTQRKTLEDVMQHLPQDKFVLPEEARTYEDARSMLEQIRSGQHPLTREGLVIHPQVGTPHKLKFRPERDVTVRNIFPGAGKYQGLGAGGFEYSHEPKGEVVGRLGTGLSDELRRELFLHPELYLGRQARVSAQDTFPSGALRAPSFIALHEG